MVAGDSNTIILGAGLAGLGAAYYSGFPVYEQNQTPGGTSDSIVRDEYVFDLGIHVLHSKKQEFYDLLKEVDVDLVTKKRKAWIYSHGKYAAYPLQVSTAHLPILLRIKCVYDFLTRKNISKPANYRDWMIQNFGSGFAENFLIPYADKFWRFPSDEMTYEWTGQRVPHPKVIEVIKGALWNKETKLGPNAEFHYPAKSGAGYAGIAQGLANKVKTIHYGMQATSIDSDEKTISFNKCEATVEYERLLTTIPLPELIKLLGDIPVDVQAAVDKLRFNSIAIVNVGIDRPDISDKHWIHYPENDISFFRISFPANFHHRLNPEGTSPIQAEISYDPNCAPTKEQLLKKVREDLIDVNIIKQNDRITFEDVIFLKYGYIIYNHCRKEAVGKIHEYLHTLNIYPYGRYGLWEYLWSDEAVLDGKRIAEDILNK